MPIVCVCVGMCLSTFISAHCARAIHVTLLLFLLPSLTRLVESGKMYIVSTRCLDDYYWMIASVSDQAGMSRDEMEKVPPNNPEGRYPGIRPILVTNDKMRDHKLSLLEPRSFRRWTSSHIVNYHFSEYYKNEWNDREIDLFAADFFSREIQGNPSGTSGDRAWHFPVTEWDQHERLCIRIPTEP